MDKIETDCIWVVLKKVCPTLFKFIPNRLGKGRFNFAQNHRSFLWCNDNFISKGIPHSLFSLISSGISTCYYRDKPSGFLQRTMRILLFVLRPFPFSSDYGWMCLVILDRSVGVKKTKTTNKETRNHLKKKQFQAAERIKCQGSETKRELVLTYFIPARTESLSFNLIGCRVSWANLGEGCWGCAQ